jgi:hypothetical protein
MDASLTEAVARYLPESVKFGDALTPEALNAILLRYQTMNMDFTSLENRVASHMFDEIDKQAAKRAARLSAEKVEPTNTGRRVIDGRDKWTTS